MIVGTGIDIVEIERICKAIKSRRFVERIFTKNEIEYCYSRGAHAASSFAARFAAKEAVIKALNANGKGIFWKEIEICRNDRNVPQVRLYGECKEIADSQGVRSLFLSLSHDRTSAIAQVILCSI